jgi:hypothetical protein
VKNPILLSLVGGVLTGMGNGSVFGAAIMCFLGRGKFDDWGGWPPTDYYPSTFTGFIDWVMIVFGIAFFLILYVAVGRHLKLESKA